MKSRQLKHFAFAYDPAMASHHQKGSCTDEQVYKQFQINTIAQPFDITATTATSHAKKDFLFLKHPQCPAEVNPDGFLSVLTCLEVTSLPYSVTHNILIWAVAHGRLHNLVWIDDEAIIHAMATHDAESFIILMEANTSSPLVAVSQEHPLFGANLALDNRWHKRTIKWWAQSDQLKISMQLNVSAHVNEVSTLQTVVNKG